jgi:hypothetical protein
VKARGNLNDLREMALLAAIFAIEIELRGDLPAKYRVPYEAIVEQMRGTPRLAEARRLITGGVHGS